MNRISNILNICVLLLSLVVSGKVMAQEPIEIDSIAIVVNDEVITKSELENFIFNTKKAMKNKPISEKEIRAQAIDVLIMKKLQLQKAKQAGISISETYLDQYIYGLAKSNDMNLKEFKEKIESGGINFSEFRKELKNQLTVKSLQQSFAKFSVDITKKDIENFLKAEKNLERLGIVFKTKQYSIPVPAESSSKDKKRIGKVAQEITNYLNTKQEIPAQLIADYSIDSSDTDEYVAIDSFPSKFAAEIANLRQGQATNPHLVTLSDKKYYKVLTLVNRKLKQAPEKIHKYHVEHILIKPGDNLSNEEAQEKLEKFKQDIQDGHPFAQLAQKYSQDPGSASEGGDIGFVSLDFLDPAFANVIRKLDENKISEPFKSSYGWHIARVLEIRTEDNMQSLIEQSAADAIFSDKADEKLHSLLSELREQAYIKIMVE